MINDYSISNIFRLSIFYLRSKTIDRNIRIIRFPFNYRGKKHVEFGKKLTTGVGC